MKYLAQIFNAVILTGHFPVQRKVRPKTNLCPTRR
jgi:hypothetical protein